MTKFYARLRTPVQELALRVRPARRGGVRLDVGDRFVYLTPRLARDFADSLHDCLEKGTPND